MAKTKIDSMRNLCVGIVELTPGWKSIFHQIGCWYEEISDFDTLYSSYSIVILNKPVNEKDEEKIHNFSESGGAILETPDGDTFSHARFIVSKKIETIINTYSIPFLNHIPFLDVYTKAQFYNGQDNFGGLIDFERNNQGIICNLGINPDELITDNSYTRKRFLSENEKHPDELVSKVSKGFLVDIITSILKELHFQQSLPFVNTWISPNEKPIFLFRVDSDFGNQKAIQNLYNIANTHQIPMTWFLHVEAHEDWLKEFHNFENQEIALHGYEHGTSNSYEHVFNNIEKGLQLLNDAGFNPGGFCAPYGIWNDTLANVLQKFDFEYTSEFTTGYDSLPFFPIHKEMDSSTLQIPIHPICTGSLNRKHLSLEEMRKYFITILNGKVARHQNVIFYHHPLQTGTDIWNEVFAQVNDLGLQKMTFSEYSFFWKKRIRNSCKASFDPETKEITFTGEPGDLLFQVSNSHLEFELVKPRDSQILSSGNFKYHQSKKKITSEEIKSLKSNKFQLLKTSLLDWRNRIRL